MKLLFYSDFYHFKEHGISISGLRYAHLPYGPVVDNYNTLITWLETQQSLILTPTNTENGWEIISTQKELEDVLTKGEIKTLEKIEEKFGALTANELSSYSHQEKAYTNTSTGELISYDYAFELKI